MSGVTIRPGAPIIRRLRVGRTVGTKLQPSVVFTELWGTPIISESHIYQYKRVPQLFDEASLFALNKGSAQ